ncbi:hypothetical protein HD554DRAFT_2017827, partial [Boletus coccyginus]
DYQVKKQHKYYIKCPNALWHVDSHYKLIHWEIVIHGFIDGHHKLIHWEIIIHGFIDRFCCIVHTK